MRRRTTFLLAAPLVIACSSDGATGTTTGSQNPPAGGSTSSAIAVRDNSFSPNATTVPRGTTITWTWSGANPHNVTFASGANSATQTTGTFQRTFATAGAFPYNCTVHAGMSGTITVQ